MNENYTGLKIKSIIVTSTICDNKYLKINLFHSSIFWQKNKINCRESRVQDIKIKLYKNALIIFKERSVCTVYN